ncbi:MAG: GTP-binding protein, partial [Sphaerochaetaceae bacterium]|nr:GTP-binding protein [Sphaerochaetaceae bacterium]
MKRRNDDIRNIAIIAHVDHGKTTLVDAMIKQSGLVTKGDQTRIMDSGTIERERGITITSKNCAIHWQGRKINILDTPGHSDFGGEVERGLSMVDGVVLLVDAAEGPLPQTRFVLSKALEKDLAVIVVINKIDRQDARPSEVLNEVYDLLLELKADESMLEVPVFYAIGREGIVTDDLNRRDVNNLHVLLDKIVSYIPAPEYDDEEPFQMLVSDLGYSDFLGRLAIGKVINGTVTTNDSLVCIEADGNHVPLRVTRLQTYNGPSYGEANKVESGDIIVLSGIEEVSIGDTICNKSYPKALARITVDEPTVSMLFSRNISPLSGREGQFVTSAKIGERLKKESLRNVSIQIVKNEDDTYTVKGRGEFQMAIIIEQMRREGFELCVGRPKIIFKEGSNGKKLEPVENVEVDCPEEYSGTVMQKLAQKKGNLVNITYTTDSRVKINFVVPSRGLIGYRDEFLTDTRGYGIMSSSLKGYEPYKGD